MSSPSPIHHDASSAEFDDLLDDIAEKVMKTGGQAVVMPAEQMPTDTVARNLQVIKASKRRQHRCLAGNLLRHLQS